MNNLVMEGIPRVPMFSVDLLIPEHPLHPNFENNIREYIVTNYQDDPSKFNYAFEQIKSMRNVIRQAIPSVESICILKRYFSQMSLLKTRFPMETGDPLAVPFSWINRNNDISNEIVYNDINFELCCVMFNIGSLHAIVAANETRSDSDSIKNSFMHFQQACWPFLCLQEEMHCGVFSTIVFDSRLLTFFSNIFLAQAQECLLEKSMIDNRKPLVIAKIAFKLKEFYNNILNKLDKNIEDLISVNKFKSILRLCSTKYYLYSAIAMYYFGTQAELDKKMGNRLSFFSEALDNIKSANKIIEKEDRESLKQTIQFAYDVIFQKEENAKKENDFIYHEKISKVEDLEKINGVIMVKPISFDINDPSVSGEDLFSTVLPTHVLKTISLYSEEKLKFKNKIYDLLKDKDEKLEKYLLSLQLDKLSLDESIERIRLPDELLSSSAAFSSQPDAFPTLLNKFNQVITMANDAELKILELTNRIKKICSPELTNDTGFKVIKSKISDLNLHHTKARENNAELQRAVAAHSENLKLLAMPLSQLTKEICENSINPMDYDEGKQLRKVLNKVDEMRLQRFQFFDTLTNDLEHDDITKRILTVRDLNIQQLFEKELGKHTQLVNLINQNLIAQDNILKALTEANANFAELRCQIIESNEKRALDSLTLVTAYQVFVDVVEKTDQALEFYKQFTSLTNSLSKGFLIIEDKEQVNQKKINEIKASKKTVLEFDIPKSSSGTSFLTNNSSNTLNNIATTIYKENRPKLGDYLDFYRDKISGKKILTDNASILSSKNNDVYLQPNVLSQPNETINTFSTQSSIILPPILTNVSSISKFNTNTNLSQQQQLFRTELKTNLSQSDPYYFNNFLHKQEQQNSIQNLNNFYPDCNLLNNNLPLANYSDVSSLSQQPQINFTIDQQNNSNNIIDSNLVTPSQRSLNQHNNLQIFPTTLHSLINSDIATQLQSSYVTSTHSIPSSQQSQAFNMIQPSQVSIEHNSCLQPVTSINNHQTQLQAIPFSNFQLSNYNYNQPNLTNIFNQQCLTPVITSTCKLPLTTEFSNLDTIQNSSLQINSTPMFHNTTLIATNNLRDQNPVLSNSQQKTKKNFELPYFSNSSLSQNNAKSPWHQNLSSINPLAAATVRTKPLNNINSLSKFYDNLNLNFSLRENNVANTNLIQQTESFNLLASNKTPPNFQPIPSNSNLALETNNQILNHSLIPEISNQEINLN